MKRAVGLVSMLALVVQVGCLLWPFPTGQLLSGRGRIRPVDTAPLAVGRATREDVLLRLGEPDRVQEGGRVLVYRWTEVRGFLALAGNGSAVAIPFPGHREIRLEFTQAGQLAKVETRTGAAEADPTT